MYFFSIRTLLISDIIITKIIYLDFLTSCTSRVALIIYISRVLNKFWSSIVFYIDLYLISGLVLSIELVLDPSLGSLNILFIIEY